MSYYNCRQGDRCEDCNGYIGPLDTHACLCKCHLRDEKETNGGR